MHDYHTAGGTTRARAHHRDWRQSGRRESEEYDQAHTGGERQMRWWNASWGAKYQASQHKEKSQAAAIVRRGLRVNECHLQMLCMHR